MPPEFVSGNIANQNKSLSFAVCFQILKITWKMSENSELEEFLTDDFIDFIDEFTEKSANPSSQPATISKNEIENELKILLEGLETPNSEDANECLEKLTKNEENLDDFAAILKFAAEKCQKLEDQEKTFKPPVNRFDILH